MQSNAYPVVVESARKEYAQPNNTALQSTSNEFLHLVVAIFLYELQFTLHSFSWKEYCHLECHAVW
jgi:hypothetical protein